MDLNFPESSDACTAVLLSLLPFENEALITSIATTYTTNAFPLLTPYQTIFVGLFLLQILIFQLIGIVPFNLNNILHGQHGSGFMKGRRKRRNPSPSANQCDDKQTEIIDKIFGVLRRMDKYDCVLRTLCETQAQALHGHITPSGLNLTFQGLRLFEDENKIASESVLMKLGNEASTPAMQNIQVFVDAANVGFHIGSSRNFSHDCFGHYNNCPITTDDILEYVHGMRLDDLI